MTFLILGTLSNDLKSKNNDSPIEECLYNPTLQQELGFTENKGQIADDKGNPIPDVLFTASVKSMSIVVTTKGLTYLFKNFIESENETNFRNPSGSRGKDKEEELKMEWNKVDMEIIGANILSRNVFPECISNQGYANYYYPHCPKGILNVKTYHQVTIKNIYPGIDWVLYTQDRQTIKYDFVIHPGADVNNIRFKYHGAENIEKADNGKSIHIKSRLGEVMEGTLSAYIAHEQIKINADYNLVGNEVTFLIDPYDSKKTLIIDPPLQLVWATYYGGTTNDGPKKITYDNVGNIFITGYTRSTDLPLQNPGLPTYYSGTINSTYDAMILKFNSAGVRQWATYYGSSGTDYGNSITADASGNIYVVGYASVSDLPLQTLAGAYNQTWGGGTEDVFISKFNSAGTITWATYFGGSGWEEATDVTLDNLGNLFVTGVTTSPSSGGGNHFPTLGSGAQYIDASLGGGKDAFILEFNSAGAWGWGTYYGGSDWEEGGSVTVDPSRNLYVTVGAGSSNMPLQSYTPATAGQYNQTVHGGGWFDAFILKFNSAGTRQWGTYYGGGNGVYNNATVQYTDYFNGITSDASGNIYLVGGTNNTNFPTISLAGAYNQMTFGGGSGSVWDYTDGVIVKFSSTGVWLWSTYFGGSGQDRIYGLCVDASNNLYVTGHTSSPSTSFPLLNLSGAFYQGSFGGAESALGQAIGDVFISAFDPSGVQFWSTYYGGPGDDWGNELIYESASSSLYAIGELRSYSGAAMVNIGGYYQPTNPSIAGTTADDGFILKFSSAIVTPINLLSFYGENQGETNVIEWSTSSETNNDYFTIEQSKDRELFEAIGIVKGSGNSNKINNYSFKDTLLESSILYYRLKQTDYDGNFTYSKTIPIITKTEQPIINIFPNPARNILNCELYLFHEDNVDATISVTDVFGNIVKKETIISVKGINKFKLNIENLSRGLYFLKINSGTEQKQIKFVKQ